LLVSGNATASPTFGFQDNYIGFFVEDAGIEVTCVSYVNANEFQVTTFGGASYVEISDGSDCHGNRWTGIFQNCDRIQNNHRQAQVLEGYAENCNLTGRWIFDDCVSNDADEILRNDRISQSRRISFASGKRGTSYDPISDQFYLAAFEDERFMNQSFIVNDTDNISATGKRYQRAGSAGSFLAATLVIAAELDPLIKAHGAATISFDAKRISGTAGLVEWSSNKFFPPSVDSDQWQRYEYTITQLNSFLRVYISNTGAGEIAICNVSVTGGRISKNTMIRQYPLLNDGGDIVAPLTGSGMICTTPNGASKYRISVDNVGNVISTLAT